MAGINGVGRFGVRNYVAPSIATTLWNGLTNYYSGDNTANDSKGSSNADLINGATYATGKINNGFSFDGINDALVLTPNPLIGGIATDSYKSFSISCWIKPKYNYYNDQGIFITQLADDGYRLLLLGDGRLFYRGFYSNGSFGADDIYTSYCIVIGNSYHIAVIHEDGVGTKIYCNDILVGSSSSTGKQYYRSTAGFRIGGDPISRYMGNFNGSIDEFGLWNRAISLSEKTELYNGGAGKQYVAPTYTARTTSFAAATGITDTTILNALNTFDTGLISNGLDTKMKALYPMVGGTATTHKYNFMDARDVDAAFRLSFNGGMTHNSNGIIPNGVNAFADTFLVPNTKLTINSHSFGVYARNNVSSLSVYGCQNGNSVYLQNNSTSANAISGNQVISYTANPNTKLMIFSRTPTDFVAYRNAISLGNNPTSISSLPTANFFFLARSNGSPTPDVYSSSELALAFLGDGLTSTEVTNFTNLVNTFQTSLGRQV